MTHEPSPTWVLLHGLLCDADTWAGFLGPLSHTGPLLAARLSGIQSLTQAAQDVLAQTTGPLLVVGHSMGGRVALEMVRAAPQRVRGLVLMNTGYQGLAPGEPEKRAALVQAAQAGGISAIASSWLQGMIAPATQHDDALMQRMLGMVLRSTVDSFRGQIGALVQRPDATELLPQIRCPVLLMSGTQDRWSPVARHQDMARKIPGAEFTAIADAGHMAPFEAAGDCLGAILDWATRHQLATAV